MPDTRHEPIRVGIGTPLDRVDGSDKVTGQAHYAAEYPVSNMLYGVIVSGGIARGRITGIDETAACAVPGVVEVLTHRNRPSTPWLDRNYKDELNIPGNPFRALENAIILFSGQPVALVLAETFEAARFAASLVDVSYEAAPHNIDFEASLAERFVPSKKRNIHHSPKNHGDADDAFATAELKR